MSAHRSVPKGPWFLLLTLLGPPLTRLWHRVRCATGHHRETVMPTREWRPDTTMPLPGCYTVQTCLVLRCMDCATERPLFGGPLVLTPSRRYALRGKA